MEAQPHALSRPHPAAETTTPNPQLRAVCPRVSEGLGAGPVYSGQETGFQGSYFPSICFQISKDDCVPSRKEDCVPSQKGKNTLLKAASRILTF